MQINQGSDECTQLLNKGYQKVQIFHLFLSFFHIFFVAWTVKYLQQRIVFKIVSFCWIEAAAKGMKDVSLTDVHVQSEEIITTEANLRNILRVDHVELERKERNHQILQNFGKALWKVLKEYKKKLEV